MDDKKHLTLEERVEHLEREVERLRRLLEAHLRDHGVGPVIPPPHGPPKKPFGPDHPDIGPPREF